MSELNFLDTGGNKLSITTPALNTMSFKTQNTERVRITSGGQVCIGTDTATRALTIKDPGQIHVESTSTGNWVGMSIKGSSGTNNYNAYFGLLDSNGNFFIDNGSNGDDFVINQSGIITKPQTPAFHVSRQAGDVPSNNYITFDHVDYNNGNHYNNNNGRFTAPVTGIYFFSAWNYTGSTSAFYLRINTATFGEYTWDDTGGCGTWVCPMTAGQYAQIYTKYTWRGTSDYHNGFCGYLIG